MINHLLLKTIVVRVVLYSQHYPITKEIYEKINDFKENSN